MRTTILSDDKPKLSMLVLRLTDYEGGSTGVWRAGEDISDLASRDFLPSLPHI